MRHWASPIGWFVTLLVIFAGSTAVDYELTRQFAFDLVFLFVFISLVFMAFRYRVFLLSMIIVVVCLLFVFYSGRYSYSRRSLPRTRVASYEASVTPLSSDLRFFRIDEKLTPALYVPMFVDERDPEAVPSEFHEGDEIRKIHVVAAERAGLFVGQVTSMPWGTAQGWPAHITLGPRRDVAITAVEFRPRHASLVTLNEFPKGSFLEARDALNLSSSNYVDRTTVGWEMHSFPPVVQFRFVLPQFIRVRAVLEPFMAAKSWPAVVPILAFALAAWLLREVVVGQAKERLKVMAATAIERLFRKPPRRIGF